MVLVLLIIFAGTLPLMVVAFIDKLWLAIIIDFFSVQAYWALNEVARDVEDPWVYEPNDLPLARLQVGLDVGFTEQLWVPARLSLSAPRASPSDVSLLVWPDPHGLSALSVQTSTLQAMKGFCDV